MLRTAADTHVHDLLVASDRLFATPQQVEHVTLPDQGHRLAAFAAFRPGGLLQPGERVQRLRVLLRVVEREADPQQLGPAADLFQPAGRVGLGNLQTAALTPTGRSHVVPG